MSALAEAWTLLEEGQVEAARELARSMLAQKGLQAEAHCLLAEAAFLEEDLARCAEHLSQALQIFPAYFSALIRSAHLALYREDQEETIWLAQKALESAMRPEEKAEARLLLAEVYAEQGRERELRAQLRATMATEVTDPLLSAQLAEIWLDVGEPLPVLLSFLEVRVKSNPSHAELLHALGRCYQEQGDLVTQATTFLTVRQLDQNAPSPRFSRALAVVEDELSRVLEALPSTVQEQLQEVAIWVELLPSEELVQEGLDPRTLGFFEDGLMPRILIFQRNIERLCHSWEEFCEELEITLLHEIGHALGLSEEDLEARGLE